MNQRAQNSSTDPHTSYDDVASQDDDIYEAAPRSQTSARRYPTIPQRTTQTRIQVVHHPIPRRATATQKQELPPQSAPRRFHWLTYVGLAFMMMLCGWMVFTSLLNWWQVKQDDWRYGRPRTFQIDAAVGHDDTPGHPSHFIALNLRRHILIIEIAGNTPAKSSLIVGPVDVGPGGDLDPVTLQFRDVNGDGKPDMIIIVGGTRYIYINDHGTFRPLRPGENVDV